MSFPIFALVSTTIAVATALGSTALARHRPVAVLVAIGGATAIFLIHSLVYFDYYADDAYITLRYSRHLADGMGPIWNEDGRVEGYTSFSWMAILAGMAKTGFDLVFASQVIGFAAILATFGAVYGLWSLWSREEQHSVGHPLVLAAPLLGLALVDAVPYWGLSGMETPLFMALVTAGALLYLRERRSGGVPISAVIFAAAAITRPEGVVAAGVTGAFICFDVLVVRNRGTLARAAAWCGLFVGLYGAYFSWRWSFYDYFFPNTYYAKVGLTLDSFDRGLRDLTDAGIQYHVLPLLAGLAILGILSDRLRRDTIYLLALIGALLATIVFEGQSDNHGRFIAPMLPLVFFGGTAGFAMLIKRAIPQPAVAMVVSAVALTLAGLAFLPASQDPLLSLGRHGIDDRGTLGSWLNENTPPDYTIADFMVGATAYHAKDRNVLDLLGLNDVVIAHTRIETMGVGVAGHEKFNADYVFDTIQPEIIIAGVVTAEPLSNADFRTIMRSSSLFTASFAIFGDPRLWERYEPRAANIDGRWYHFFQRRDTVAGLQTRGLP